MVSIKTKHNKHRGNKQMGGGFFDLPSWVNRFNPWAQPADTAAGT